jgi:hypothetical protein
MNLDLAADYPGQTSLEKSFEQLPDLVNTNRHLCFRGRRLTATIRISIGPTDYYLSIEKGRIVSLAKGPALLKSWIFSIRAEAEAWEKHWRTYPPPWYHDLFAMSKNGTTVIEGNLTPLMAHLQYIKDVLAAPRKLSTLKGGA